MIQYPERVLNPANPLIRRIKVQILGLILPMIAVDQFVQLDAGGQDHGVGLAVDVPETLELDTAGGDLLFEG